MTRLNGIIPSAADRAESPLVCDPGYRPRDAGVKLTCFAGLRAQREYYDEPVWKTMYGDTQPAYFVDLSGANQLPMCTRESQQTALGMTPVSVAKTAITGANF